MSADRLALVTEKVVGRIRDDGKQTAVWATSAGDAVIRAVILICHVSFPELLLTALGRPPFTEC